MRVLVTGGSGFLGGRVILALVHASYEVQALVRKTSKVDGIPPLVELVYGDIRDLDSIVAAVEGCDVVLHLGALVGSWLPDQSQFCKVNVEGLKNVIEAVKRTPSVTKLIYTSSFFALGPSPAKGQVVDESQVHSGKNFSSEYERSKYLADIIARNAAKEGLNIVMLYPGVIYGIGNLTDANVIAELMVERFTGRLPAYPGFGKDRHSFCHVDDVVMGHLAALEKCKPGERYLLTGDVYSITEVLNLAADLTNTSKPPFAVPLWTMTVAGYGFILWARLTGQRPVITPPAVDVMRKQWIYSHAKAERELGYKSRPFRENLAEMLVWLKDSGNIKY
ncbi:unnamed protein product [Calypogeia fissa]